MADDYPVGPEPENEDERGQEGRAEPYCCRPEIKKIPFCQQIDKI